jgi:hypothetical protein
LSWYWVFEGMVAVGLAGYEPALVRRKIPFCVTPGVEDWTQRTLSRPGLFALALTPVGGAGTTA